MTALKWEATANGLTADVGALGVYTIEPWHAECILKHSSERHLWNGGGTIHKTVVLAQEYVQNIVNDAENPVPLRKGGYTLDDFAKIVAGEQLLPNVDELKLEVDISNIASLGHMLEPKWGYSLGANARKEWTQYFLNTRDGSGWALIYPARIVRFAICRHQKKTRADANPSRGWHPGHCIKCGLDLTVDSSD